MITTFANPAALLTAVGRRLRRPRGRPAGWALAAIGLVTGLVGALLWGVAALSVQHEVRVNETLLWAWPLDLWLAVAGPLLPGRPRLERLARRYVQVRWLVVLAAIVGHPLGLLIQPQEHFLALWLALWLLGGALISVAGGKDG